MIIQNLQYNYEGYIALVLAQDDDLFYLVTIKDILVFCTLYLDTVGLCIGKYDASAK